MNWTNRPMRKWLLIAPLLLITPLMTWSDTHQTTPLSEPPSMISIDACTSTCALELEKERAQCNASASPSPTSTISLPTCESDCTTELHSLRHELETECDKAATTAVAEERRSSEPLLADMTAQRDSWEQAAKDAAARTMLWQIVGVGGAVVGVVGILAALLS